MKCQFCKKEFKTEVGYNNHKCLKKSRYENFNLLAYYIWKSWNKLVHLKLSTNEEKNKLRFINAKEYLIFEKFSGYINELQPCDCYNYLEYLVKHNIPPKKWISSIYYHQWVYWYELNENKNIAIVRSKEYLNNNGIEDINTVSENRLFNLLWNGRISPWYIQYIDIKLFLKLGDDLLLKLKDIISIIEKG